MSVTQEAVNSNLEIRHNDLFSLLAFVWLCGVSSNRALKIWCGGAAADRTQGSQSERHNPVQPVNSIVTCFLKTLLAPLEPILAVFLIVELL